MNNYIILVFVITTVFTVSLTETIQISDGLLASSAKMIYEIQVGETQMQTWAVTNNEPESFNLELYATGPGSELLVFEEMVEMPTNTRKEIEVFVIVPADYQNNVEFHPELFALKRGTTDDDAATGVTVNLQMRTIPIIKIGDNPVYTPPTVAAVNVIPEEIKQTTPAIKTIPVEQTLEEKLASIQAANEKTGLVDTPPAATGQFEVQDPVPELQVNDKYLPEPIDVTVGSDYVVTVTDCGWFDMILSWFGIGKC